MRSCLLLFLLVHCTALLSARPNLARQNLISAQVVLRGNMVFFLKGDTNLVFFCSDVCLDYQYYVPFYKKNMKLSNYSQFFGHLRYSESYTGCPGKKYPL